MKTTIEEGTVNNEQIMEEMTQHVIRRTEHAKNMDIAKTKTVKM